MTFRLPFQIFRAGALGRTQDKLFYFITKKYVNNFNTDKCQLRFYSDTGLVTDYKYKLFHLPLKLLPSKEFARNCSKESKESKDKVRKANKCDEKKEDEPKLAFRQTTKLECCLCMAPQPSKSPKLGRPIKMYDDSVTKYRHSNCADKDECAPRMDAVKGYKVKHKNLPKILDNGDCKPCIGVRPQTAPKLRLPQREYDPYKFKWKHANCPVIPKVCPRMDDICGYKVVPKNLPKLKNEHDCKKCMEYQPTISPKLVPLKQRYDPLKLKYNHSNCQSDACGTPRMDKITGYKVEQKKLPQLPKKTCMQYIQKIPDSAPKLEVPRQKYDPLKLDNKHTDCLPEINVYPLRMDELVGLKTTKRTLPKINETCMERCLLYRPYTAPALKGPRMLYDAEKLKKTDKDCEKNLVETRMDKIVGYKTERKILPKLSPKLSPSPCCQCQEYKPSTSPKLERPNKLYNDSKMKYPHNCFPNECNKNPPRMDSVKGYKIIEKELPPLPRDECKQCTYFRPQYAPHLKKLVKRFDDTKMEYSHNSRFKIDKPPRMDDVVGLKVKETNLPILKDFKNCHQCQPNFPTKCPKLQPPIKRFDPNDMKYNHECNKEPECVRMDEVKGYKVTQKHLPKFSFSKDCQQCTTFLPTTAPELVPPKPKYDSSKMEKKHLPETFEKTCPSRMDDILCWKPVKKKLPSFSDKEKFGRYYSTFNQKTPRTNKFKSIKFVIYPRIRYTNRLLLKQYQKQFKRYLITNCHKDNTGGTKEECKINKDTKVEVKPMKSCEINIKPEEKENEIQKMKMDNCNKDNTVGTIEECKIHTDTKVEVKPVQNCEINIKPEEKENEIQKMNMDNCNKDNTVGTKEEFKININTKVEVKSMNTCEINIKPEEKQNEIKKMKMHNCPPVKKETSTFKIKLEPPYNSFGDNPLGLLQPPTECDSFSPNLLQPKNQVTSNVFKLNEIKPKWKIVNPDIERNCFLDKQCEKLPPSLKKSLDDQCSVFKLRYCNVKARKQCDEWQDKDCKRLPPPYKSFSDRCPQFPTRELTECELAEQFSLDAYEALKKKSSIPPAEKVEAMPCDLSAGEPRPSKSHKCHNKNCVCETLLTKFCQKLSLSKNNENTNISKTCSEETYDELGYSNNNDNSSSSPKDECCEVSNEMRRTKSGILDAILNYFKARNCCPEPKAEKAAKAAGLKLNHSKESCSSNSTNTDCSISENKKRKTFCKKPNKTAKNLNSCRKYSSLTMRNRFINSCHTVSSRRKRIDKIKKQILSKELKLNIEKVNYSTTKFDENAFNTKYSSEKYMGKIYKLKLTKIGIKNTLISNDNDHNEPHTICYICKVVPRRLDLGTTDNCT